MSSQRGNAQRQRPQKHKNGTAFKNNLYDNSNKIKMINAIKVTQCCARCTEIIEWKIKYKKYKPLTTAKKCTKCFGKTVKRAYCIMCEPCATANKVCMKCGESKEVVQGPCLTEAEEATKIAQLEQELKYLPERKRRTFLRLQESGQLSASLKDHKDDTESEEESNEDEDEDPSIEDESLLISEAPSTATDDQTDIEKLSLTNTNDGIN